MTRWETAGLSRLGEVVAAGDSTSAAGEGGVQRTGSVAWLPDLPFSRLELVRFFRHQRTIPTRVHSLGLIHFPNFVCVINSWSPSTEARGGSA